MAKQSSKTSTASTPVVAASAPAVPVAEKVAKAPKSEKTEKVAKTEKTEKVAKAAAAPAVVAAAEEKVAKTEKVAKVAAVKAPKAEKVVAAAPAAVAVASAEAPAEVAAAASVSSEFSDFMGKLQQLSAVISSLKTEFRALEKKASRELKTAAKASHKRKRKTGNRSPSGFVKPTLISDELATFLGKTSGTEMARTEVTREINAYIRANQLQDTTNGRRINADSKLSSLLKLASGEELTYFNLQRYMSPHFAKTSAAAPAPVASA